jgi:dTDP-4-amino-4,6-dideoxygalactose transaminase
MKVSFSPPDLTEEDIQSVVEVLKSGWITTGPKTKEFECKLSSYCGTQRTACLNSATAALELTLRLLGIGEGDEIITSAYTYTASASVIHHVGAEPVLVDTAKNSFEMDYEKLSSSITKKTKAIIPVDIAGIPCDYEQIFKILDERRRLFCPNSPLQESIGRVAVIADAAHSLGAVYKGRRSGAITDFTCFSFHAVKNLTTGEGGAVTWRNIEGIDSDEIYRKYMLYSLHGQSKDAFAKNKAGSWEYDIIEPFYKCNMPDTAAALGLSQLRRYGSMLSKRHEIAELYNQSLKHLPVQLPVHTNEIRKSSAHLYMLRLLDYNEDERNRFITKMAERGISCNVHYKPLPMLSAYKNLGFDIELFPNSYEMYKNEVTLPLYSHMKNEDVEYVTENMIAILNES